MSNINELTKESFEQFVADGISVVDFWAPWCGPCRALAPVIDALAEKYKNKIKFAKLNVDETPEFALKYNVDSIPNVCVIKEGNLIDRSIGYVSQAALEDMIQKHI